MRMIAVGLLWCLFAAWSLSLVWLAYVVLAEFCLGLSNNGWRRGKPVQAVGRLPQRRPAPVPVATAPARAQFETASAA